MLAILFINSNRKEENNWNSKKWYWYLAQ
jgi:hypothetical protein